MAILGGSIGYVLENETGSKDPNFSGYTNNRNDLGRATAWGITQATLSKWRRLPCSPDDVKALTKNEAIQIYKAWFWEPLDLDKILDQNVATCIFDCAVNRGNGLFVATTYSQYACNGYGKLLVVDGHIGPKTIDAINSLHRAEFIESFYEECAEGYQEIVQNNPSQKQFIKGWLNRAKRMLSLIPEASGLH